MKFSLQAVTEFVGCREQVSVTLLYNFRFTEREYVVLHRKRAECVGSILTASIYVYKIRPSTYIYR